MEGRLICTERRCAKHTLPVLTAGSRHPGDSAHGWHDQACPATLRASLLSVEQGACSLQVVFTIHNLEFGQSYIGEAAYYCQRFTTVSPTYAMEVRHAACTAHTQ